MSLVGKVFNKKAEVRELVGAAQVENRLRYRRKRPLDFMQN